MTAEAAIPDGSALCVGCGLCCNGTLYDRVSVTPEEQVRLTQLGFSFVGFETDTVFELPCHKEVCGSCTIYEARPATCADFRCGLLQKYQAGHLSLEEGKAKQDKARELIAAVVADDPVAARNGPRHKVRSRLAAVMQNGDGEARRAVSRQFLNIVALDTFLERWFRAKDQRASTVQTPE